MPLTNKQKTAERRAALNELAQAAGWAGIDDYLSAVRAKAVKLTKRPQTWVSRQRRKADDRYTESITPEAQ